MKAAFIEQYGGPEVLKYGDLPDPSRGRVRWSSMWLRPVSMAPIGRCASVEYKQSKFPFALGRDFSGVISAIGEGVADLKVGDAVFGVMPAKRVPTPRRSRSRLRSREETRPAIAC